MFEEENREAEKPVTDEIVSGVGKVGPKYL